MITRRQFLASSLTSLVTAPFVRVFNQQAYGQTSNRPRRLLIFFSPDGVVPSLWKPTVNGTNFEISDQQILAPLRNFKDDLLILDGIDFLTGNNHEGGMAAMLTNGNGPTTNGRSVDQVIASHIGNNDRFKSLEFGILTDPWGASIQTRMCYSGAGQFIHPDADPRSMYRRMFGAINQDEQALVNIQARRQSVLDLITGELNTLHGRLGQVERIKLEQHLDSIREMERSLFPSDQGICQSPQAPSKMNKDDYSAVPQITRSQIDLAITALACEMTKVATVQLSHTVSPVVFSWVGNTSGHHSLSHTADGDQTNLSQLLVADQWCAEQFSYMIQKLKDTPTPDSNGTLFDDTLCIWVKELGDSRLHVCESVPFVIAGSAGGLFQTGRYLSYDHVPHSQLLVSLCQAFGMTIDTFGNPTTSQGPLGGLTG